MVAGDDEGRSKVCVYGCGLLWILLILAALISSCIFAYVTTEPVKCRLDYTFDGDKPNKHMIISINSYFALSFMALVTCVLYRTITIGRACIFRKCMDEDRRSKCAQMANITYMILLSFTGLACGIVGIILYIQMGNGCRDMKIGMALLQFAIISIAYGPCFSCLAIMIINKIKSSEVNSPALAFERL